MADNKRYYYLKVKDNFFESDQMLVLEAMQDGYLYSNILLKLYLRSLKNEGKLMFNDRIPYNSTILSQVVRHPVGVVEKAIGIFKEFGLIDILDNGAIYMLDIQNYIGTSSTEADRQREYQHRILGDKKLLPEGECKKSNSKSNKKSTPELEIEIEKEIEIDKDKKFITVQHLSMTKDEYNKLVEAYGKTIVDDKIEYCKNYAKLKNYKSLYLTINNWLKANKQHERQYRDASTYKEEEITDDTFKDRV